MCRKKQLQGWCCLCFGLGLMVGHALNSWFFCSLGGAGMIFFGFFLWSRRR